MKPLILLLFFTFTAGAQDSADVVIHWDNDSGWVSVVRGEFPAGVYRVKVVARSTAREVKPYDALQINKHYRSGAVTNTLWLQRYKNGYTFGYPVDTLAFMPFYELAKKNGGRYVLPENWREYLKRRRK